MRIWLATARRVIRRMARKVSALAALVTIGAAAALAQPQSEAGGEASLRLPDLSQVRFLGSRFDGHNLLLIGILFCLGGS